MNKEIYTIGHSVLTAETFVEHLHLNGITAVADVRSAPFSRFQPHFNRNTLKPTLKKSNIDYIYLGDELGDVRNNRNVISIKRSSLTFLPGNPYF